MQKFRAVITANMLWDAVGRHRLPKGRQDLLGPDLSLDADSDTLARKLIEHGQHLERAAHVRPVKDKIPAPDVVAMGRLGRQARRHSLSTDAFRPPTDFQALFPPNMVGPAYG